MQSIGHTRRECRKIRYVLPSTRMQWMNRANLDMKDPHIAHTERLVKKKEVASLLACSERTVDRLVNFGRLTRIKVLGGVRFRFSEVMAIMQGGKLDILG